VVPPDSGATKPATSVDELRRAIEILGARLALCNRRCEGVRCDLASGAMPRCLIFESGGRVTLDGGVIVVGVNPGQADDVERRLIRELYASGHEPHRAYARYVDWLATAIQRIPFYTLMRAAVATMGFTGPILWTEIVKCESGEAVEVPGRKNPVSFGLGAPFRTTTVRVCRDEFLRNELALCPPEWPIVAASLGVGDYLEETRTELAGNRSIIAVPHPTGSEDFLKVFIPKEVGTSDTVLERVRNALSTGGFARISSRSSRGTPS